MAVYFEEVEYPVSISLTEMLIEEFHQYHKVKSHQEAKSAVEKIYNQASE